MAIQQNGDRAKLYFEGLVLVIGSRRSGEDSTEWGTKRNGLLSDFSWLLGAAVWGLFGRKRDRAKRYFEGLVLVIGCSRFGCDSAEWGTDRRVMLREWYRLLGVAGAWLIQQNGGQSETLF